MVGLTPHFSRKLHNFITVLLQKFTSEVSALFAKSTYRVIKMREMPKFIIIIVNSRVVIEKC